MISSNPNYLDIAQPRVLISLSRSPWATARQISDESSLALDDVQAGCERLLNLGAVQQASVVCSGRTNVLYAPSSSGIIQGAKHLGLSPESFVTRTLRSATRFWALRGCQDAVRATYLFCAHLLRSQRKQGECVTWDLFVPRHYKAELFFHARINISPVLDAPSPTSRARCPPTCRGSRTCSCRSGTAHRAAGSGRGPRPRCRAR